MYASHLAILSDPVLYLAAVTGVQHTVEEIQEHTRIDAIAMRGISGMAVGFPVCALTGISPAVVRKSCDKGHSHCETECPPNFNISPHTILAETNPDMYKTKNYVIIDDFICNGETVTAIIDSLPYAKCVGIILYEKPFTCHVYDDIPVYYV
jgi:adenine/guanine phosphoribosyltransferase-like PRPP-binding protein